jgi:tetratricopeptide (TPR) repeat protein
MKRLLLALVLLGCSPERGAAYERAFAEGAQAETAGRYGEAAERYDAAANAAKLPRDGAHARYLAAVMLMHAGEKAEARVRLDAIAAADPPGEDAASAAYRAADMRLEAGDEDGWTRLEALLARFPNAGVARAAFHRLVLHEDEVRGKAQTLAYLRRMQKSLDKTELGEGIAYRIAGHLADLGETQAARDGYVDVATRWPYPQGALFDDSLFHASELDEKLGKYAESVHDLERMLDEREVAQFSGSYQRPRYGPALMRIATLYRDRLHDNERAKGAFHRLYTDFMTSPFRDDALWQEAELWSADGDTGTACARLATLAEDFPDSRYVPCAVARCPRVKRAERSKAPKTCHPYIERSRVE